MLKHLGIICALATVALMSGGCATAGKFERSNDPKRMVIVVCTERPCTPEQSKLAGDILNEAVKIVNEKMSGPAEAAFSSGSANVVGGVVAAILLANPLGGGIMASILINNGSQGVIDGRKDFRYAETHAVTEIAELLRQDRIKQGVPGYEIMEYVHFVAAFVPATPNEEFVSGQAPTSPVSPD